MSQERQLASPSRLALLAAFAAIYIIWGSTYLAIRIAIETLPPFLMAAFRFLLAGILVYGYSRFRGTKSPTPQNWASTFLVGALMLGGGNGGVVWAEQWVPSGIAALLVSSVPLWMVLLDWYQDPRASPSFRTTSGLILGFCGVALLAITTSDFNSSEQVLWLPVLALLLASISWSLGSTVSRGRSLPASPFLATGMQMIGGGVVLLVMSLLAGEFATFELSRVSYRSIAGLAYLLFLGSIVALSAYVWLLRKVSAAAVSTYAFVNPVVAVFLGWLFVAEALTPEVLAASLLIVVAVVLVTIGNR